MRIVSWLSWNIFEVLQWLMHDENILEWNVTHEKSQIQLQYTVPLLSIYVTYFLYIWDTLWKCPIKKFICLYFDLFFHWKNVLNFGLYVQICYIIYYIYFYMKYIITSTKMKRIVQIFEQCLFTYNQSANNSDPLNETELPFQLNRLGCGSIHICCHFLLFEIISEKKKVLVRRRCQKIRNIKTFWVEWGKLHC